MNPTLLLSISIILNLISIALVGALFYILYTNIFSRPHLEEKEKETLDETKKKSASIINKSIKQASQIVTTAELKGLGLFAKQKQESKKMIQEYRKRLEQLEKILEQQFLKRIANAEKEYANFLDSIKATLEAHIKQSQEAQEKKSLSFIEYSKKALDAFVNQIRTQVKSQVDEELAKTKQEIENYKKRRIRILDEYIVEILEKTLRTALGKKLSLGDQSELIYKALQEAKQEHALD